MQVLAWLGVIVGSFVLLWLLCAFLSGVFQEIHRMGFKALLKGLAIHFLITLVVFGFAAFLYWSFHTAFK